MEFLKQRYEELMKEFSNFVNEYSKLTSYRYEIIQILFDKKQKIENNLNKLLSDYECQRGLQFSHDHEEVMNDYDFDKEELKIILYKFALYEIKEQITFYETALENGKQEYYKQFMTYKQNIETVKNKIQELLKK